MPTVNVGESYKDFEWKAMAFFRTLNLSKAFEGTPLGDGPERLPVADGAKSQRTVQEQLERFARMNAVQFQEMNEQVPTGRVPSLQTLSSTPKGGSHSRCENPAVKTDKQGLV